MSVPPSVKGPWIPSRVPFPTETRFRTPFVLRAVSVPDRVLVMSQRPGRIIEEIAVEVGDRDNPMKRRQHPRIAEYVVRLMGLLQIEQAAESSNF